ncbi:hypothetical protein RJT34_01398 [Clitoria ternatea]|uniref:Uncharacterized protein n=1 Tax=Clitoria ternatea TaxID=43366 RepID=A0AAN9Q0I1_CLITE
MEMEVIDLSTYLWNSSGEVMSGVCSEVSRSLREKEQFCPHPFKLLHQRPHFHYQVGVTPEGVEVPRSLVDKEMQEKMKAMAKEYQPHTPVGPDLKWRYFWRIVPRPSNTRFQKLIAEPVIPEGFPEWKETMDSWGHKMMAALEILICPIEEVEMSDQMICTPIVFKSIVLFGPVSVILDQGPHLLAPTGSNLQKYGQEGTVLAGYHYDLNFLTIHGRSTFPGLNIWLRNGQKVEAKVPVGCLLIQTGKQIEWLTGGDCMASMHELVVTNKTIDAINVAKEQKRSLWRVSSTLFAHIGSDVVLKPSGHFIESPLACKYPPIYAGDYVEEELAVINVKGKI